MEVDYISELRDNDSLVSFMLNTIFDGVYIVDKNRKIVFWNKGAEKLTGFSSEEVMGRICAENILNHIDERGVLLCRDACPIVKVLKNGEPIAMKVYPKHKSGKRFPIETHISAIRNKEGDIIGSIEVFRDITVQEEYKILQEKFDTIIKRYVSNQTYEKVRSQINLGRTDIRSQQAEMTIMYLDIVGFTSFAELHKANETVEMLNNLFAICEVIIKEFYGDIDKFIGDAIMAVFNDPNDAVSSALKILTEGLPDLNERIKRDSDHCIDIRIGINSGVVIQGNIGTSERKDLTVIGDAVNIAARLEKLAPTNHLLISEATLSRLDTKNFEEFDFYKEMSVRGKKEMLKLFINNQAP